MDGGDRIIFRLERDNESDINYPIQVEMIMSADAPIWDVTACFAIFLQACSYHPDCIKEYIKEEE